MTKPRIEPGSVEHRLFAIDGLEVREASDDGSIPMKGYATPFDKRANIYGMFTESFREGAFKKTIQEADVRLLINHDATYLLARSKNGTLRLSEDRKGLHTEADMAPTTYAADLAILMKRGDMSQMSVGFRTVKEEWDESKKLPHRTVTEAELFDVSVVTFPAYKETSASLRSLRYNGLVESLGLFDLPEEEREAFINELLDQESRGVTLERLRERIDLVLKEARAEQSRESETSPVIHEVPSLAMLQRRSQLTAVRYGLA